MFLAAFKKNLFYMCGRFNTRCFILFAMLSLAIALLKLACRYFMSFSHVCLSSKR